MNLNFGSDLYLDRNLYEIGQGEGKKKRGGREKRGGGREKAWGGGGLRALLWLVSTRLGSV